MFNSKKRMFKKTSNHILFYEDKEMEFGFYWKMNNFYDISILVFDFKGLTYKEFIVDFATFKAVYEYANGNKIVPVSKFIESTNTPKVVDELVANGATLLKNSYTKNYGASVVVTSNDLAITLKRIVYAGLDNVIAIDTISLPIAGAKKLEKVIKKKFKKANIEFDLGGDL